MTENCTNRLEHLLKKKIRLLEQIYESDSRIRELSESGDASYDIYDGYLDESEQFLARLSEADEESDEIIDHLKNHPDEIRDIPNIDCQMIRSLLLEIDGKTEAIRQIENQIREQADNFIKMQREEVRMVRKQSKVVGTHYSPQDILAREEMSTFDTKN